MVIFSKVDILWGILQCIDKRLLFFLIGHFCFITIYHFQEITICVVSQMILSDLLCNQEGYIGHASSELLSEASQIALSNSPTFFFILDMMHFH